MDIQILKKYNKPGPRYTSYPPATYFHSGYTTDDYIADLRNSNSDQPDKISLYVHIPFCPRLCHFCGCNTSKLKNMEFVERYIHAIVKEIDTISEYIDLNRNVTQIHWGGGTPNSIPLQLVSKVMDKFSKKFKIADYAEIAMECSPAYLEFEHIDQLADMGFNRLSLGIQDFDRKVLDNVNRSPSKHPIEKVINHIKGIGFDGINLDLIYGLPGQNRDNFKDSIKKVIEISPDRLVTFSYAHVPWVKDAQKYLEILGLPSPEEKLEMFNMAYQLLTENGYMSIGMDHYAKPDDELAIALKNKELHRNFQGYCTRKTTGQVYGFGSTSISQLHGAYIQNSKNTNSYVERIEKNGFAVERGYSLDPKDIIRRSIINEIMCNGYLDLKKLAYDNKISLDEIKEICDYNPDKLQEFIEDNLLSIDEDIIKLNPTGFFVVRNIAMKFDPLLKANKAQYSKTI